MLIVCRVPGFIPRGLAVVDHSIEFASSNTSIVGRGLTEYWSPLACRILGMVHMLWLIAMLGVYFDEAIC